MAKRTDGEIILGLNITDTTAEIQSGLNKVLQNTKVQHLVLKTAIDRDETEKAVTKLANDLSNKAIKLGIDVEVNAKDVESVLVEQQKIASIQAGLNREMDKYRALAKDIGITLSKTTWNDFNHAISTADFSKAKDILKSAKQQINDYNKAVKSMNADTSMAGGVSSIVDKFSQLKNVSAETQKKVYLLKANLTQFEQADSTKAKLSAYRRLQTLLTQLNLEYQQLNISEKNLVNTTSIQDKVKDAQSLYVSLSKVYSTADGQAGEALKSSLAELSTALDAFEKNSQGLSGGKLAAEWDKVDTAVQNVTRSVKEYRAEQTGVNKLNKDLDSLSKGVDGSINSLGTSKANNDGITALQSGLETLKKRIDEVRGDLADLDPSDSKDVIRLRTEIKSLLDEFEALKVAEKASATDSSLKDKITDARSYLNVLKQMYSAVGDSKNAEALTNSIAELGKALNNVDDTKSGEALTIEWNKVDDAVQKAMRSVKEYKAEQSGTSKLSSDLDSVSKKINNSLKSLGRSKASNDGIVALKAGLNELAEESEDVRKKLTDLDPSNSNDVKKLRSEIDALIGKYNELKFAEKTSATDSSVKEKIANARSYLNVVKQTYSVVGDGKNAGALTNSISELNKVLDNINANASGETLAMEWNKVDEAVQKVVRSVREYKAEQSVAGKMGASVDSVSEGVDEAISSINNTHATGAGVDTLKTKLQELKTEAQDIKTKLADLDPSNGKDVTELTTKVEALRQRFRNLSGDIKVFGNISNFAQFEKNVESARQKVAQYADTYSAIKARPELVAELKDLQSAASKISSPEQLKSFNAEFARFDTKVIQAGLHCESLADKIKRTFSNFAQFFSASHLMYRSVETVKDMANNVKELDTAMIELRRVTNETDAVYEKFLTRTKDRAVELGTTITDLVKATSDYARLGFSIDEATKLGEIATIYANVGDDVNSIDDATNILITSMKAFGLEAEDAMSIVDKMNKIGNEFAISSGNLGEGLTKAASYLQTAGNTIDESLAMITAMTEITQDATESGNALKVLAMRLRGAKTEIESTGESTDGMAESTSKLREQILALTNVDGKGGFDIMLDADNFKSTYDIMQGIASVWSKINNVNQAALIELIAGKQRGNSITALLTSMSRAEEVLEASLDSSGSAMEEYEKYLGGIEAKTNQFKASFEALSATVMNSDFLKGLIDSGTSFIQFLDNAIEKLGGFGNALMNIVSILAMLNAAKLPGLFTQIISSIGKFTGISKIVEIYKEASAAGLTFTGTLKNLGAQLAATATPAGIASAAISGVMVVLTAAIAIYQNHKQKLEEQRQAAEDSANALKENAATLDDYKLKVEELRGAIDSGNLSEQQAYEKRAELLEIEKSLIEMFGKEAEGINFVTGSIKDQIEAIDKLSKSEWTTFKQENIEAIQRASDMFTDFNPQDIDFLNSDIRGRITIDLPDVNQLQNAINSLELDIVPNDFKDQFAKEIEQAIPDLDLPDMMGDNFAWDASGKSIYEILEVYRTLYDITDKLGKETFGENYLNYIGDLLSSYSEQINAITSAIDNNETTFNTYVEGLLNYEKEYSVVWGQILVAQKEYDDALLAGDDEAASIAMEKMKAAEQAFLDAGWDNEAVKLYVQNFFDKFETEAEAHAIKLKLKADLTSEDNNISKIVQDAANKFKGENGEIDLYSILNVGTDIENGGAASIAEEERKAYVTLKVAADEYGTSVEALINLLAELGLIELKVPEVKTPDFKNDTTQNFKDIIGVLKEAKAEYEKYGAVTTKTYNKVISNGEDYADLFNFTTGEIKLQNDELDKFIDNLIQTTAATMAKNGATAEEIYQLKVLSSALRSTKASSDNAKESVEGLVDILNDTKEGTEYSTLAILDLIENYPELAGHIIETANGYKIERQAVLDLISAKAKLIETNESLLRQSSRSTMLDGAATVETANMIDDIFANAENEINSFDDFVSEWEKKFNRKATGNWVPGLQEYVEAVIADNNKAASIADIMADLYNPDTYKFGKSGSKDEETQFEKDYKKHQHNLAMNKETTEQYLNWLDSAYKEAYRNKQIELDDYYKYEEEVYKGRQDLFQDIFTDGEHQIDLLSQHSGNKDKIITIYEDMQEALHNQAEHYRSLGLDENSELIQQLQKQWWDYEEAKRAQEVARFEDQLSVNENLISQNQSLLDRAVSIGDYSAVQNYTDKIVAYHKNMQQTIHDEAEYYRSLGYAETSDEITKLKDLYMEHENAAVEAAMAGFKALADSANETLDEIQGVYDTLTTAAQEYADSGFITVDTLQDILSMGTKYLAYLTDENGQLVINEENIRKVIAAKTDQVAVDTALNYIEQLRVALNNNDAASLENLLNATDAATGSTWDLVYAQLAALNLSGDQYDTALQRINAIRSLADTAVSSIGHVTGQIAEQANEAAEAAKKALQETSDALKDILDYTMDMIKQEVDDQIDALNDQIDKYQEIVDLKKEALELTKEQDEYDRDVSKKVGDISKLQSRIQQLSLDDSREAQAERFALEEELAELQGELQDFQADHAYDATINTLDKQAEAFEKSKQKEIEMLEDSISSYQKLYDKAIARIESSWSTLYDDLTLWNYTYGNSTTDEITSAWNSASTALQEYGGYLEAVKATQDALNLATSSKSNWSVSGSVSEGFTFSETQEKPLNLGTNKDYSADADNGKKAADLVREMKQNSAEWLVSSEDRQNELAAKNEQIAKQLEELLGFKLVRGGDGAWYINNVGGALLYDKYHTGGIVGGNGTLKDNEAFSVLENGELVLDKGQKESLYKIIDISKEYGDLLSRFSSAVFGDGTLNNAVSKVRDIIKNGNSQAIDRIDSRNGNNSVSVDASIVIHGDVDKDTWTKIRPILKQHQTEIAEIVNRQTYDAFSRRGIKV